MEYPMICFNYGRPNQDGTYKESVKWGMIGVIIHEVGHNYFPMIINSDERQWTWMDEGLDTFIQTLTEREYYPEKPAKRGRADLIVNYMKGKPEGMRPIMTNSEQILQFGANAYSKPAAALDILRRTIMGPELFDYAFKTYAERWAFKRPSPGDFFRTMEDASAVDLDWFWRGWFFTTDNVDIALDQVKWYQMEIPDPELESKSSRKSRNAKISSNNSEEDLNSFGDEAQKFTFKNTSDNEYREFRNKLDDDQIKLANADRNFYELTFSNNGGLAMPIIIEWTFSDGTNEKEYIPAEIWRKNENQVSKVFVKEKEVVNIIIDPDKETADINLEDNVFPRKEVKSRFDSYKK
jgi:aminopeptidase N